MSHDDSFQNPQPHDDAAFNQLAKKMSHIKGWAIDANPKNDPTYPIRSRFDGDRERYRWERPAQQDNSEEILKSNERPNLSSVFGTSTPPSNVSGAIRRYAFRFSEGRYRHWLLLLLADRINVAEGLVQDVAGGHLPRCLDERGLKAEWKHNRKAVIGRAAIGAVAIGAVALLLTAKKNK